MTVHRRALRKPSPNGDTRRRHYRNYRTGRYEPYRRAACFCRAALFASLGGWAFLAACIGIYYDSLAVAFVASPLFFGLMAFALAELERVER